MSPATDKPLGLTVVEGRSSAFNDIAWHATAVDVVMPLTDWSAAREAADVLSLRAGCVGRLTLIHDDAQSGFLTICNQAFRASEAAFFVYLAQDAFPGRRWLELGLHVLQTSQRGLLAFNDGKWFGQLAAFGLVRRQWALAQYNGDLFHPGYHSHYADTELTLLAQQQDQLSFHPNALLMEIDAKKDRKPTHAHDKQLFAQRAATGFDGKVNSPDLLNKFR